MSISDAFDRMRHRGPRDHGNHFRRRIQIRLTMALCVLVLLGTLHPCWAQPSQQVMNLNNEGVKALNNKNWQLAFDKLTEAHELDPTYNLPKDNLIIAHNYYGEQLKTSNPAEALKQFHQAVYLCLKWGRQPNYIILENIGAVIEKLGKKPNSFAERVALGEESRAKSDNVGAAAEYWTALQLKDDAQVHTKLGDSFRSLGQSELATAEYAVAGKKEHPSEP
jgi:hypothetical protein